MLLVVKNVVHEGSFALKSLDLAYPIHFAPLEGIKLQTLVMFL